jgi:Patatin-like phospholipase
MPTPILPRAEDHFPSALKTAEQAALAARRQGNQIDPRAPLVGVALSGGGIRSATFCLGLFQALARQKLIRRIDYLSTVSGGGYFGSFLGSAFAREKADADTVERELADNHSWTVNWLRENGRFLSPNGSGDNWLTAAVALRNWIALHLVLLTFIFFTLTLGMLVRADLTSMTLTRAAWRSIELFFWNHAPLGIWWSPWMLLPAIPFAVLMVPTGVIYWSTQLAPVIVAARWLAGIVRPSVRKMTNAEFAARAQNSLTRGLMVGLISTSALLLFAVIDSLGQTAYLRWSQLGFPFPALWAGLTGTGFALYGFAAKLVVYLERLLGAKKFRIPFSVIALALALLWLLLIVFALSVIGYGIAWRWNLVWDGENVFLMSGGWALTVAVTVSFVLSWIFSRSFGFVNLSSMQQVYAARISRAYLGATNPQRRRSANHSMTELIPGDELSLDDYLPHEHGGPLHLINVTVNETVSGRTQIERRDRKGVAMAIGPCGLSLGTDAHALWCPDCKPARDHSLLRALWEDRKRAITPIHSPHSRAPYALHTNEATGTEADSSSSHHKLPQIEALSLGRWAAISGAAFTTGTGANTQVGLSLLLGLANVRLGYWWDSGIKPLKKRTGTAHPNFMELASRFITWVLPVQTCLMSEFFARFHGPERRHWYLSDGGHFENTACYELIRRRVPLIICSDAGQDPHYQFADLANLVRKARTDFGAEIQVIRRTKDLTKDDPGMAFPMPTLEQIVHPELLDVIGSPEDFPALSGCDPEDEKANCEPPAMATRHALLARIHYLDTNTFSWLLMVKPSLMGDESMDVIQYQRTHPLFPQEPTSDQYFDEAQWESYRKLGEHIGVELFTPPTDAAKGWSPSQFAPPVVA